MKSILILLWGLILIPNLYANDDKIFYVSPGLTISWNFSGEFILSPKISFGVYENKTFYNLTFGYSSSKNENLFPYYFIEGQIGKLSDPMEFKKIQLFTGLGIGLNIHTNTNYDISYRASLFSGYGFFAKASFLYKDKLIPDLGLETVLPIPLNKFEFGSPGGIK